MIRFDAMALSLGELSLNLLFSALVLYQVDVRQPPPRSPEEQALEARVHALDADLRETTKRLAAAEASVAEHRSDTDPAREKTAELDAQARRNDPVSLRSRAWPACAELRPLFAVTVVDDEVVERSGELVGLSRLLREYGEYSKVQATRERGCVFVVVARPSRYVTGDEYSRALRRIEQHFYVSRE